MTPGLTAAACLSLTGRFAQFGWQAEQGLRLWADDAGIELKIIDDRGDPAVITSELPGLADHCDVLIGPYSTLLTRAAIAVAQRRGRMLFNHGGSGGRMNVPGLVVNVLTPADRYAEPFVRYLATAGGSRLFLTRGPGVFGRDVLAGARTAAHAAGIPAADLDWEHPPIGDWVLLSAGVYEDDVAAVRNARRLNNPPRLICSVAAGVMSFAGDIGDPEGVLGIGQWAPGTAGPVDVGMDEAEFLTAWQNRWGGVPDYPGVQAYAAGVVACAALRTAGTADPRALWQTLCGLDFTTIFGRFRIDPATGIQVGHEAALTRWADSTQTRV